MGTEHAGPRALLVGAVAAAMTLAVASCSSGDSNSSSLVSLGGRSVGSTSTTNAGPNPSIGAGASNPAALSSSSSRGGAATVAGGVAGGGYTSSALPAAVWTNPSAIPLDATYHWRSPAAVDKKASPPELTAVQDCQLALSSADKNELAAFPAAQADLTPNTGGSGSGGRDDWSAQETVLATGDTSSGDIQGIYMLYTDLVGQIGKCANTASGAKLTDVTSTQAGYAATITIPTSTGATLTVHEYLAAPYGYLVELSVWVAPYDGDKASTAWDGASSSAVLAALSSGPCAPSKAC